MYPIPYYPFYPGTVGEIPSAVTRDVTTFQQALRKFAPFLIAVAALLILIGVYIKFLDPVLLRRRLLKQRDAIVRLGYLQVAGKKMTGPKAQKWVNEQLAAASDFMEDPMFDIEAIRPGKQALVKED